MQGGNSRIELEQLEEGLERVTKKQKTTLPKTIKSIDALIQEINKCKQQLMNGTVWVTVIVNY